jgi:diguanylate cyclase (GGDEF)-like protein
MLSKRALQHLTAAGERLLETRRPDAARRLSRRELRVEAVAAALYVAAAFGLAGGFAPKPPHAGQALVLAVMYAALTRVRFAVGSGFMMPTQLALVPIMLLMAPAVAPAVVGAGLVLSRAPDLITRRAPATRLLSSIADGWYSVAPAALLALIAPAGALEHAGWPVWAAALALQLVSDLAASTLRESIGAGVSPTLQAGVIAQVAVVDVLLSPIGLLAAVASRSHPYMFLLTLPLVAGLRLFARERAQRIMRALALLDDLDREHERVRATQRRIGETAAANLDREALERIIVTSAVELVEADAATLTCTCSGGGGGRGAARAVYGSGLEDALDAVVASVDPGGGIAQASAGEKTAVGVLIGAADQPPHVLAVARRGRAFSAPERELLQTLAEQASVCLENLALHERVQRLATTDELTGLLNHRRLQEVLEHEVQRAQRYATPLALVMLDIDDFKRINDCHGHQQGDAVLRAVADAVSSTVRSVDTAARYGGEELAVTLPNMDLPGAIALAERIRQAIGALRVPTRGGGPLTVTASLGVAVLDPIAPTRRELIAAADEALYRAKRGGKNRVEHGDHIPVRAVA